MTTHKIVLSEAKRIAKLVNKSCVKDQIHMIDRLVADSIYQYGIPEFNLRQEIKKLLK